MSAALRRVRQSLYDRFGVHFGVDARRPEWRGDHGRVSYQTEFTKFDIPPGSRVLDVGNGGNPFPYATVLVDRFLDVPTTPFARTERLVSDNKPFVMADIHALPFRDKSFDYIYCVHVLEVIEDPLKACQELMRVGTRGFIETPTAAKDTLFAWARGLQRWHVVAIGATLCFFEYTERELDGIRSNTWKDLVFSPRYNPIQKMFFENLDVFNVMFTWSDRFSVFVFRLDGSVQTLNAESAGVTPQLSLAGSL